MEYNKTHKAITFLHGEETDVVIARTKEEMKQSLLNEQYQQALNILNDIIWGSLHEAERRTPASNIIAFCGDRGEGKTSALLTVHNILLGGSSFDNANSEDVNLFPENNRLTKNTFKVLKLVEPAFFDEHHNLLELLIGQMYADILQADKEAARKDDYSFNMNEDVTLRNHLMQHFHNVRKSLSIINKPSDKSAYDNLEEIDQLAAGIELKDKVNDLMHCYAKYFGKERVLISIDDLDLNVSEGYPMAEEIRKYLSSPQVCIVMMAIKVDQLVEVIQSYLRKQIDNIVPNETITEMALRYVTKLLPLSHRVMMPSGESIVEKPLNIQIGGINNPFDSVKEAVVRMIYRKTRYIFVNGRNISPIVPTNLRSVRHLLGLLCDMPNITNTSGEEIIRNQTTFKNYFYHTWVRNLKVDDAKFVNELIKNEDLVSINKSVVLHLRERLLEIIGDKKYKFDGTLLTLLDPLNTMQNVSLGDAFYVLKYIDDISTSIDDKNLVFFLRAFYSIKLYEAYNFISFSEERLFVNEEDQKPSIYKYDEELRHLNLLQRLINGSYFTYELGSFMPLGQSTPREKRVINGDILCLMMSTIKNVDRDTLSRILPLCEFFVLTTCYPAYANQGVNYNKKMSSRSYYTQFTSSNHSIVFDVLSVFNNLINVKFTYQRWNQVFGGDFFEYALNTECSLLKRILETCENNHQPPKSRLDSKLHSLISEATIRFSEVQLAIMDYLINHRDVAKGGGNANNIRIVYSTIQSIGIKLYPITETEEEKKNRHELKFLFLTPIIEFLTRVDNTTFDEIYTRDNGLKESMESIESSLNEIFKNSLAQKGIKYPKNKKQVIGKISTADAKLYRIDKKFWEELIHDDANFDSWENLREVLSKHIDEIRALYEKAKQTTWTSSERA